MNYGSGDDKKKLDDAIDEFLGLGPTPDISRNKFAKKYGIPTATFKKNLKVFKLIKWEWSALLIFYWIVIVFFDFSKSYDGKFYFFEKSCWIVLKSRAE